LIWKNKKEFNRAGRAGISVEVYTADSISFYKRTQRIYRRLIALSIRMRESCLRSPFLVLIPNRE